ncbi:hypothetical protein [Azospirillum himalayense]|uniref:Uncharacterized protein n=1 Tax=Azospirillum himalayense TaxID=654847 RepID=A0ABW0G3I3_9PROT
MHQTVADVDQGDREHFLTIAACEIETCRTVNESAGPLVENQRLHQADMIQGRPERVALFLRMLAPSLWIVENFRYRHEPVCNDADAPGAATAICGTTFV